MSKKLIVECFGGPHDGLILSAPLSSSIKLGRAEYTPQGPRRELSTYAFEATDEGQFRLRHICTVDV